MVSLDVKLKSYSLTVSGIIALCFTMAVTVFLLSAHGDDHAEPQKQRAEPVLSVDETPVSNDSVAEVVSYADMLEQTTPAVVGVVTTQLISGQGNPMTLEDLFRRYYGMPPKQEGDEPEESDDEVDERRVPSGMGSGVIVSEDGYVLTNNHVVRVGRSDEIADEILVQLYDGREFTAKVIGTDSKTDVAVLKIEVDEPLPAFTFADSDKLRVGDVCFAIGNPLRVGLTVTKGIVSGLGRTDLDILGLQGYEDFVQTDAAINRGNSGGALVDAKGRLIGINTAILSGTGGNIGIGFAIPSNLTRYVMESLISVGEVPRGFLGVVPGNLTPALAEAWGLPSTKGALIRQVEEDGAAAAAGIKHRDVIIDVDGRQIDSAAELRLAIAQTPPGVSVDLKIIRDGEVLTKAVTLGSLGERLAIDGPAKEPESAMEDVELSVLTPELRKEFSIPSSIEGIVVKEIIRVTPQNQLFRPGMVIREVNETKVTTIGELAENLRSGVNTLYVWFRNVPDFLTYEIN